MAGVRKIQKFFSMSGTLNNLVSPVKNKTVIPGGFPYEAFNGRGKLHPRGIMMLFERARGSSWFGLNYSFQDMTRLCENNLCFMASASLEVEDEVYNTDLEKQPITIEATLAYVGKSSFKLKTDMFFPGFCQPLVKGESQYVIVDIKSKRPSRFPQWWTEPFEGHIKAGGTPLLLDHTPMPEKGEVAEEIIKVLPSDTDFYEHAGSANYIKFVFDSYIQWHQREFGLNSKSDAFRDLKKMTQSFKGEAGIGDELKVLFWQSQENRNTYHFHLIKDEHLIHECVVEFNPETL